MTCNILKNYFLRLFLLAEFAFKDGIIYIWKFWEGACIEFVFSNMSVPTIFLVI